MKFTFTDQTIMRVKGKPTKDELDDVTRLKSRLGSVPREQCMSERIVPMIHVPDVKATADWYTSIGFKLVRCNEEEGEMNWALLSLGSSELMLQAGGKPSAAQRREVDLYVHTDNLVALHARISGHVEMIEGLHDTFYGMSEFIIRDINGFWLTFGQPVNA